MNNPFDDPAGTYHVLVNHEDQYCLWPAFAPTPAGWRAVLSDATRQESVAHIEENWTDMRPRSLVKATRTA
ncbi:MbtH family protein [Streptomyces sp. ATE26]|uniref:MbtH family protein n=1 Tax=Streptomyces sp. ATE26 TaxID=2954237 RepID=UPI0024831A22|nr:MbtH family protein [Streptomyces sp. ATE26]MDI1457638.1 MbtH family protein [Streptomyces sp. ATE26]